ncbi:MAG: DUF5017 domain-containing protein [Flavobacterium sp.]|nr:DUF5017 domain-containing protein [Flavobacterium sp.]
MKTNILQSILFTTLLALVFSSCVNDDTYPVPDKACIDSTLSANKQVQDIIDQAPFIVDPEVPYANDDVIEAFVVSSDEGGNFYKSISFQTKGTSSVAPVGFSVPVDVGGTFANFRPGTKVYIKMKGLYTDIYNSSMRIGSLYLLNPATEQYAVGRLSIFEYGKVLKRSCDTPIEEDLVRKLSVSQALNDSNLNTLIELQNVQFDADVIGKTYYDAANDLGGATNHLLSDEFGNKIIFRTSSFANFAGNVATSLSGTVRGVLTKFGSDYQFLARTEADIKLTNPRLTIDFSAPIVGNAISYSGNFTENFESYVTTSPGNKTFPKYINDPVIGARYWENRTYASNKYIQMSSFGGTAEDNRTLFIVPVDMTAANTFSFKIKIWIYKW